MFEINMDEYLDEEVESLKQAFEKIIRTWSKSNNHPPSSSSPTTPATPNSTRFLGSHNPALVKRNLLASFTDVLLLPVTIVPRTVGAAVGAALTTGGTAAAQGIAMLNPQRWGGGVGQVGRGYSRGLGGDTLFEGGEVEGGEDGEDEFVNGVQKTEPSSSLACKSTKTIFSRLPDSRYTASSQTTIEAPSTTTTAATTSTPSLKTNQLELLLSLDIALELIHADRESLKRTETFAGYPGHYGHRVHDTIEEIFILLLEVLDKRHVSPGFGQ
jgi:recyclin-1